MSNIRLPQDYEKKVRKSKYNLGTREVTTLLPGMIIPIYSRKMMPGDRFHFDVNALIKSIPLQSPLYSTFKLQTAIFFDSDSNYYGWMDNNRKMSTSEYLSRRRHTITPEFEKLRMESGENGYVLDKDDANDIFTTGIFNNFRGSILDYMNIESGLLVPYDQDDDSEPLIDPYEFDAGFVLTYLNIFRNYYASKQEDEYPFLGARSHSRTHNTVQIYTGSKMSMLDELFMKIRMEKDGINLKDIKFSTGSGMNQDDLNWQAYLFSLSTPNGGILLSTFLPDYYRNLLSSVVGSVASKVTSTGNQFTIDSLRFANKLQRFIDRVDVSGGRWSDALRTVWGVKTRKDMDIPELMGVSQSLIDPSQVTATAQTGEPGGDNSTDLGQFGGNFDVFCHGRRHSFTASTPGRVMVCVTLVPQVDYCQGISVEASQIEFADDFAPEFDQLGFQPVPLKRYTAGLEFYMDSENENILWKANKGPSTVIGKQIAWLDLMTDVNHCHGEFANNGVYRSWVLQRNWMRQTGAVGSSDFAVKYDITHYINPLDFQYPFLYQNLDDMNWFLQIDFAIDAVRPKGKRFMPNLE